MPIKGIDHINIRTPDYAQTVVFLETALGLSVRPVPDHDSTEKFAWVYDAADHPLLHIAADDVPYSATDVLPEVAPRGSGAIQHIGLACEDYEVARDRLVGLGLSFRENVPYPEMRQIFVQDPTGIMFELNFGSY